jgi:hypothetical protein
VLLIGPETSDVELDKLLRRGKQAKTRLVKGCPCYKEFAGLEREKVCLNNDDILPIHAISVDPSFFEQIGSIDELVEYKSDNESMCYLLIYLDRKGGHCYCVSQNQRISINEKDVKVSEIDNALQFVTSTEKSRDGVICSDCLYKYLRTLGEASTGFFSDQEREEIIISYVREVATRMAIELSNYSQESGSGLGYEEHVKRYIKRINDSRSQWASLRAKLKDGDADKTLIDLVDNYGALYRLEAIFLTQVLDLGNTTSETDALGILRFMVIVSEKVIRLSDMIREKTNDLLDKKEMSAELERRFLKHSKKRQDTEYRFSNLVKVLSEIQTQTTQ